MELEMLDLGSSEGPRAAVTPRRRRLRAAAALSAAVLAGAVGLAGAQTASGVPAPSDTRPAGVGADTSTTPRAAVGVGLFPSGSPASARLRAVDKRHAVRVGTTFKAKAPGKVLAVRVYQPFASGSATPRSARLWSASGKRLAKAHIARSAGVGWKTVRLSHPVRLRAGSFYTVSAYSPAGTYARTKGGFKHARSNAYLVAPSRLNGVIRQGRRAVVPSHRAHDHSAFWVDVVFRPRSAGESTAPQQIGPRANGCAPTPSRCGYPDRTNTGPASLSGLTAVPAAKKSGPGWSWNSTYRSIFVHGENAVLDHLDVHGAVVIDAPNVTLSNSRIAACGGSDDSDVVAVRYRGGTEYQGANARIVHNQILGTPSGCAHRSRSGVRDVYGEAPKVTVQGNDISGTGNGITIEYSGVVSDNWIHDLGHLAGDHHSGISSHGGAADVVVRHNTVLLYGQRFAGGGGVSGALTVYSDFGHAQNVTLRDNLISGGSYVVYGGDSGDSYSRPATNIKILDNRFVCGDWLYGPIAAFSSRSSGNELTGNYCDQDGSAVR